MAGPTSPTIFNAENTVDSQRLVAAQARMYSDAKRLFFGRVIAVAIIAMAAIVSAILLPDARAIVGGGGGVLLLFGSISIESVEKRRRLHAAATQELFDTRVFQIGWNKLLADRPPQIAIAQAAERYDGGRDKNWYDDTGRTYRPFDVLICQASNLGWGATMHRLWAWMLTLGTVLMLTGIGLAWCILHFSFESALAALLVPSLAPLKELASLIRANFENAATKEGLERRINEMWDSGMVTGSSPSDADLRGIQDKILILRQTNSYVPDWLDRIFHRRNEAAMRATVADRVVQAQRSGLG